MKAVVIVEVRKDEVKRSSLEALTLARMLSGGDVSAIVGGACTEPIQNMLAGFGAKTIFKGEAEGLAEAHSASVFSLARKAVAESKPNLVILAASFFGKELAGRLSGALDAGLAQDCVSAEMKGENLLAKRPVYAGKAVATVKLSGPIQILTIRPNSITAAEQKAQGEVRTLAIDAADIRTKLVKCEVADTKRPELTEAEIVVSGGRGLKGPENFPLIESLADQMGAAVGASRAVVDAGWRPHSDQVGQTGKVVSPKLYLACGISGAIQHFAGMGSSKCIVAVNKDPEAPIFKKCDFGIVGDLFEIIPLLTESLKNGRA